MNAKKTMLRTPDTLALDILSLAPRALAISAALLVAGGCAVPAGEGDAGEDVGEATEALVSVDKQYNLIHDGKCIDVSGGGTADNTPAIAWSCHEGANQRFSLVPVAGSWPNWYPRYYIWAQHSQKCLDVEYGSTSPGARIIQYGCHSGSNQIFHIEPNGQDTWSIISESAMLCLVIDASGNLVTQQCSYSNLEQQRWSLSPSHAPSVTLYRDVDYQGPALKVSGDMPTLDLPGQSYTDMPSSLTLTGGAVVSTYSGPNYTGTCQAFRHDHANLFDSVIGNDNIASLRLGAFCGTHQVTLKDSAAMVAQLRLKRDGVWGNYSNTVNAGGSTSQDFGDGSDVDYEVWMFDGGGWLVACEGSLSPWSNHTITLKGVTFSYGCSVD